MSINFFESVGVFVITFSIIWLLYKLLFGIWSCWVGSYLGFGVSWTSKSDTWAVITGASDGLGIEFAKKLTAKGYSVLLISRKEENLRRARAIIESDFPQSSNVRILPLDLSHSDIYDKLQNTLQELGPIDVLVNNCGISYRYPEYFTDIPSGDDVIQSIINVNIVATTKLIRMVLPQMLERKRGVIINLSSIAAHIPLPLLAVYSASKIYVDYLSRALSAEYKDQGIVIQCLIPGYVVTNMSQIRNTSWIVPSASRYVSSSLKTVGIEDQTQGYWAHKLLIFARSLMGTTIDTLWSVYWLKDVRRRYYNKMARHQARKEMQLNNNGIDINGIDSNLTSNDL